MQQLLAIVQQKAMVAAVDSTLKFALSALWNLTDETPAAAENFLSCQGLELYEEVLEVRMATLTTVADQEAQRVTRLVSSPPLCLAVVLRRSLRSAEGPRPPGGFSLCARVCLQ